MPNFHPDFKTSFIIVFQTLLVKLIGFARHELNCLFMVKDKLVKSILGNWPCE